jgi:4-hydroxybenzoate polyprenyltransferase
MLTSKDLYYFVRIARPNNLGIALLTYGAAAYVSARWQWHFAADPRFWLEGLLIILIMATGYWVNDVYDFKIDRVNKPSRTYVGAYLSRKKVLTAYFAVLGFIALASLLLPFKFLLLNYPAMGALYVYARFYKRAAVVGNLIIASLTSAVILAGGFLYYLKMPQAWMMAFAFLITFIREVTKDVEDIRGDLQFGLRTLPILVGIRNTKRLLAVSYVAMLAACNLPLVVQYGWNHTLNLPYLTASLLGVQLPLLYNVWLLAKAYKPADFGRQSALLKIYMLTGLLSTLLL